MVSIHLASKQAWSYLSPRFALNQYHVPELLNSPNPASQWWWLNFDLMSLLCFLLISFKLSFQTLKCWPSTIDNNVNLKQEALQSRTRERISFLDSSKQSMQQLPNGSPAPRDSSPAQPPATKNSHFPTKPPCQTCGKNERQALNCLMNCFGKFGFDARSWPLAENMDIRSGTSLNNRPKNYNFFLKKILPNQDNWFHPGYPVRAGSRLLPNSWEPALGLHPDSKNLFVWRFLDWDSSQHVVTTQSKLQLNTTSGDR
jgi:hypothetical protein